MNWRWVRKAAAQPKMALRLIPRRYNQAAGLEFCASQETTYGFAQRRMASPK